MRLLRPLFIFLAANTLAAAQPAKPELISPQVKAAVDKAVAWLIKQQNYLLQM